MKLTWREMHKVINHKTEDELKIMIAKEFDTLKRPSVLIRLHQRFTILRAQREREELLGTQGKRSLM